MSSTFLRVALGIVAFMVLDGIWLGVLMKGFYRNQLAPIARLADGALAPNWFAAAVVYVMLGVGIAVFAVPRASSVGSALGYGALLGLVVYGVYDFTNFSTLRQYPFAVTLVDFAWGGVASALGTMAVWWVTR